MSTTCDAVAIVDDDLHLRRALLQALELEGLRPLGFAGADEALAAIDAQFPGIVVTDLRMPGMDGTQLFARLATMDPDLPVVIITGHGDLPTAVDLMRRGAYDFLSKPFDSGMLAATVRRALEKRDLVLENRRLRDAAQAAFEQEFAGVSPVSVHIRSSLRSLAGTEKPLLLIGEPGTGKSHCARLVHRHSRRAAKTLVTIDCDALPEQAEAFLAGHVSGAMPGGHSPRSGALRRADQGTVVLDRVDRLPQRLQPVIERVLEDGAIAPLGGDIPIPIDLRIIATADPGLQADVDAGRFSRSLYHRLAGATIELPPLRTRGDDIQSLFGLFLKEAVDFAGTPFPVVGPDVVARLRTNPWLGNAHEVKALADQTVLAGQGVGAPAQPGPVGGDNRSLKDAVARYEAEYLREVLAKAHGDIEQARLILSLPRKTLYDKMARHGLVPGTFRRR
ncbi:sigma-54-dependent transcriptional regulator [Sphingopyxis sp. FD7]|uniref:sigma-54-dependent transcriptional regulator n=1 Tax=Sphingopyxis sp. FD7 TaxID=1914525 RepID=UPI000DC63222|nr:sigma-54 dependent transcriptional regulator [Sphingopyxis sp. FD7]BBB14526.1 response regulator [Sphingopyxis sp. FD7]